MNSSYKKKLFITKIYKIFRDNENSFRTLMYHSIFDDKINVESNSLWKLSLSLFKKQIDYLKKDKRKMIFKSETLLNDCPINGI